MKGFKVYGSNDGLRALEIFKRESIDIIISDSSMPGLSGQELLREVRSMAEKSPLFFLFSGDIFLTDEQIKEKGATALISKPFDLDEILLTVINSLEERDYVISK